MTARFVLPRPRGLSTRFLGVASLLIAVCAPVFGQTGNATIAGTVQDTSGAVIVSAHVAIINSSTGVVKSAVTSSAGQYFIENLIPGGYTLDVTAQGMGERKIDGIQLEVDQQARVDVKLEVGSAVAEVQVSAEAALLQTTDPSVGTVVGSQQLPHEILGQKERPLQVHR